MTDILPADYTPPEELLACAQELRRLADGIESGDVTGVAYVAFAPRARFRTGFVKVRSISTLEVLGGTVALQRLVEESL